MLWILHLKSKRCASENDQLLQGVTWSEEMDDSSQRLLAGSHASSLTSYLGWMDVVIQKKNRGKTVCVKPKWGVALEVADYRSAP
jgi:hypothetical protein